MSYTRPPEFDDGEVDEDQGEACKHIVYQPLSAEGLHGSSLLPKDHCYRGDSFWEDKPHSTGDKYADEQAEKTLGRMTGQNILEQMDYLVINLQNTLDEATDFDVANAMSDPEVWGAVDEDATPSIIIITSTVGTFEIDLAGTGDVSINWGDGTIEVESLGASSTYSHIYTAGGTVTITNVENITGIDLKADSDVSAVTIAAEAINLIDIDVNSTSITAFETHVEWVAISTFDVSNTSISSLATYAAWTALTIILTDATSISSFETHAEWTAITIIDVSSTLISSLTTYAAWTALVQISVDNTLISSLTTYAAWTALQILYVNNTLISSLTTYAAWTALTQLHFNNTSISSLTTYAAWTLLTSINGASTSITNLVAHSAWTAVTLFRVNNNAIVSATNINNELIALDAAVMSSGTVDTSGGTNAAPTGAGITAKNNLIGRGVSVTTN